MCGVIGYKWDGTAPKAMRRFLERLLVRSQMRGRHATGIAWASNGQLYATKDSVPADEFILTQDWNQLMTDPPASAILHTRYSTSGDWHDNNNNQPIIVNGLAIAHNGLVSMATKEEFQAKYDVCITTENDSEIIAQKIVGNYNGDWEEAIETGLAEVNAVEPAIYALCLLTRDGELHARRDNVRPLYRFKVPKLGLEGYCSTLDIFIRAAKDVGLLDCDEHTAKISGSMKKSRDRNAVQRMLHQSQN
jgi:glutamine---fructose-6-phosphate transaminase (isomerizing)